MSPHRNENRLAAESSPYLLQHRYNPVDWYAWGDEAFAKAQADDKVIFLSIGYATCHWCHVMERESFEDDRVADLMNADFVSIKVDREERPDIDQIYMSVCQLAGGHCGWPLTVLLTPDKKPFFVATYIPRESRHGRTGMTELLPKIAELWSGDRSSILASADEITNALVTTQSSADQGGFTADLLDRAVKQYEQRFDPEFGGFSSAPKFPAAHNLLFLMEHAARTQPADPSARPPLRLPLRLPAMVSTTLHAMRRGGIFDHVGFGFHRYSTDREWKLPHFEKMLYDQAMLCLAYAEAWAHSGDSLFAETSRRVANYVGRVMTSETGAFYSAEDADSEGEEGRFYVWTMQDLVAALGSEQASSVAAVYNAVADGNFADESTGQFNGQNVLHLSAPLPPGMTESDRDKLLEDTRPILFGHREKRPHPFLDDKILVDWNGLMIAALARSGFLLDEPAMIQNAERAARWIGDTMMPADGALNGMLLHRYRDGAAGIRGMLDDYAFLAWGLIELYEATYDSSWLERAIKLALEQIRLFLDEDAGGFFLTDHSAPLVLHRPKELADGALPCGNSVSILNFARLFALTGDPKFEDVARGTLTAGAPMATRYPSAFGGFLLAAEVLTGPSTEVVIVGERGTPEVDAMLRVVRAASSSRRLVSILLDNRNRDRLAGLAPFTAGMEATGPATAYVCSSFVCDLPVTSVAALGKSLADRVAER